MTDIQFTAAAAPSIVRLSDYRAPDWMVPDIILNFDLDSVRTRVRASLSVERHGEHSRPLRLDGDGLVPLEVRVDGRPLDNDNWHLEAGALIIALSGSAHRVETLVELTPDSNSKLMGLYASGGLLCTQCEAEGFRRITFFPDRPDILSRYTVDIIADKSRYPVLLANGDPVESGDLDGGRHWARWTDPFPKPCYLFALVAGDLACNADSFVTMSGREVALGIWVREADLPRTSHAMQALKDSMAWDERVYAREYDLNVFNIVAVSDFNFGAMENKGLNIFNSRYILADPETATDIDYDGIEAVVAHEYFHNWSGNRVTCRDWFQLSLKEGFTVFRDQNFSADMGSHAVKRIEDVRILRAAQFQEDSGPLAHPVRPESYMEISNFYTATIYNKGAELIRMMALMLGAKRFRAGTDLYFARHDGQAATCEDFVLAMEEGGGADFTQFRRWYEQAGTPHVRALLKHDPHTQTAELSLEQHLAPTPGQPDKLPMAIPLRIALFDPSDGTHGGDTLLMLTRERQIFTFTGFATAPILSINRGFSAPVVVETDRSQQDLAFLSAHDDDPFARYEAMQQLMVNILIGRISGQPVDETTVITAIRSMIADRTLDSAFVAEAVRLPSEAYLGDQMAQIDPNAIHAAREALQQRIGAELEMLWRDVHARTKADRFTLSPSAKGARRLRSMALQYLVASAADDGPAIAFAQFHDADNMTERQAALAVLANGTSPEREAALDIFYNRYGGDALTLDKWFQTQAFALHPDTIDLVRELGQHKDFTLANPNRVRALYGAFAGNQWAFHHRSGAGYQLIADCIIALDPLNPQTAARLVPPLGRWKRFDYARATMMRAELQRILARPGLSKDVTEQASKSLNG
ncbi:aminopeptidase N [Sphingobium sp.]|uniref:aminopeptidase N n=1 Tax=Sphingobium sp. TaxID=1912891 RepID=UPI003BB75FEF